MEAAPNPFGGDPRANFTGFWVCYGLAMLLTAVLTLEGGVGYDQIDFGSLQGPLQDESAWLKRPEYERSKGLDAVHSKRSMMGMTRLFICNGSDGNSMHRIGLTIQANMQPVSDVGSA